MLILPRYHSTLSRFIANDRIFKNMGGYFQLHKSAWQKCDTITNLPETQPLNKLWTTKTKHKRCNTWICFDLHPVARWSKLSGQQPTVSRAFKKPQQAHAHQHVDLAHHHKLKTRPCLNIWCKKTLFGCKQTYTHSGIECFTGKRLGKGRTRWKKSSIVPVSTVGFFSPHFEAIWPARAEVRGYKVTMGEKYLTTLTGWCDRRTAPLPSPLGVMFLK